MRRGWCFALALLACVSVLAAQPELGEDRVLPLRPRPAPQHRATAARVVAVTRGQELACDHVGCTPNVSVAPAPHTSPPLRHPAHTSPPPPAPATRSRACAVLFQFPSPVEYAGPSHIAVSTSSESHAAPPPRVAPALTPRQPPALTTSIAPRQPPARHSPHYSRRRGRQLLRLAASRLQRRQRCGRRHHACAGAPEVAAAL